MPKSEAPRNKKKPSDRTRRAQNAIQDLMQRAHALDRRRQAQITNQIGTINRLLERFDEGKHAGTSHAAYTEEMRILHEGAAESIARGEELTHALSELVNAVQAVDLVAELDNARLTTALDEAKRVIALSAPVTHQEASAG